MSDFESLLFGSDPDPELEQAAETAPIVIENALPDEEYLCPKCGKKYRAIFLMRPVNYNCTRCWSGR